MRVAMMVKTRCFPENNYKAVWFNGKTMRSAINPKNPITELEYPEFYDVKITSKCEGGCEFCYMDSKKTDDHYGNIVQKIDDYFGSMSQNERPFQIAYGGGEPTFHPGFVPLLTKTKELGIEPNYTTNGMWVIEPYADFIVNITKDLCGGVAVSCHPHLRKFWEKAAHMYRRKNVKLNFHLIISDADSIDYFMQIYNEWEHKIDYFVLLPYAAQGRAVAREIDWDYLVSVLPENTKKIAFGAGFYPYLMRKDHGIKVSLYEPETMSKFLDLKDMSLHPSSFNLNEDI